jgi:hypothetical protein
MSNININSLNNNLSFRQCNAPRSPSKANQSLPSMSILNYRDQPSQDSLAKDRDSSSQDTSTIDEEEGEIKRQKIELAIDELNLDEETIKDLKGCFNFHVPEIANALLGLRNMNSNSQTTLSVEDTSQVADTIPISNRSTTPYPRTFHPPAMMKPVSRKIHRPHPYVMAMHPYVFGGAPVVGLSPYRQPHQPAHVQHAHPHPQQIPYRPTAVHKVKEFTSIKVKLRQTETHWEVMIIAPEYTARELNMRLVQYPVQRPQDVQDALLIEASKLVLVRCVDGSMLEKNVSARSLVPLGGLTKKEPFVLSQIANGCVKARIAKLLMR